MRDTDQVETNSEGLSNSKEELPSLAKNSIEAEQIALIIKRMSTLRN